MRFNQTHPRSLLSAGSVMLLLAVTAVTGCRREEVSVYTVDKEKPRTQAAAAAPHGGMGAHGAPVSRPGWKIPEGWREIEAGGVRLARFLVTGAEGQEADTSVIPLPSMQAGKADLVNIWRDQIGLAPASAEDLAKSAQKVPVGASSGEMFEMLSEKPVLQDKFKARVLVAVVSQGPTIWVFKMGGADELVQAQRPKFLEFLSSIQMPEAGAASAGLPQGHPPLAGNTAVNAAASAESAADKPAWEVPPGWEELPPTQMLLAKFATKGESGAKADITVSFFPGETGGLLANVNRWRGQLELDMVSEAELKELVKPMDLAGGKATVVDMDGTDVKTRSKARLVGVVFAHDGKTWFFKMLGDARVVDRERAAFLKFVQSVKFPNA